MLILWRSIINPSVGPWQFSPNKSTLSIQNKQSSNPSITGRKKLGRHSWAFYIEWTLPIMGRRTMQQMYSNQAWIWTFSFNFAAVVIVMLTPTFHSTECLRVFCFTVINGTHYFCYSLTFLCWLSDREQ